MLDRPSPRARWQADYRRRQRSRKLLKDCIRGMVVDWDIPAVPLAIDADGEADSCTQEQLELFFDLVAEVVAEDPEPRQFVLDEIAKLEREYLSPDA
jgi:hypothetical protein